jgi:uncharacterized protein YneF (UPF0154 family)
MFVVWILLALIIGSLIGVGIARWEASRRVPVDESVIREKWEAVNEYQRKKAARNHHQ